MKNISTFVLIVCLGIAIGVGITLYKMRKSESFSWAPYTPRVKGVTITNNNTVAIQSGLDSGMLTPDAISQMMPDMSGGLGKDGYDKDIKTIQNSLELQSTQEDERMQLAAAMAGYVPPEGNTHRALWTQRNTVDNLFQPGLDGSDGKPTCACK